MKDEHAHLQLFDLIARDGRWHRPSHRSRSTPMNSASPLPVLTASVHMAATADKASPNLRIRRAVDTGRLTIAPREKPFCPLKAADFTDGRSFGGRGVWPLELRVRQGHRADQHPDPGRDRGASASPRVGSDQRSCRRHAGRQNHGLCLRRQIMMGATGTDTARVVGTLAGLVRAVAFSPDGRTLAVAIKVG